MRNKDGLAELVKLVERFENLDDAILGVVEQRGHQGLSDAVEAALEAKKGKWGLA